MRNLKHTAKEHYAEFIAQIRAEQILLKHAEQALAARKAHIKYLQAEAKDYQRRTQAL